MRKLARQSNRKKVEIEVGDSIYTLKSPYCENAYELVDKLANCMIWLESVVYITAKILFKVDNIKNVKDHILYKKHILDKYVSLGEKSEHKRLDPNFQQALA